MSPYPHSPEMDNTKRTRQQSLSGALSVSLGLSSSYKDNANSINTSSYLARSYLGFSNQTQGNTPRSYTGSSHHGSDDQSLLRNEVHKQAASLAADDEMFEDHSSVLFDDEDNQHATYNDENTPLVDTTNLAAAYYAYNNADDAESQIPKNNHKNKKKKKKEEDPEFQMSDLAPMKMLGYVPGVILGLLLNILDGLSYGMIIFPIGEVIFSDLGSAGLSMFYVSCVVSQLVYSLGGSAFRAGIGSEMIEVTPFFHAMAAAITRQVGEDKPNAVIATTITTYAISSVVTGLTFLMLGKFKLGQLVGFFPRHILIGCIGGVGYFLVITGIEISSKLGGFEYNWGYISQLFVGSTFIKWFIPVVLTIGLIILQHYQKNGIVLPTYFLSVFLLTHIIIIIVPTWDLRSAREAGFMFSAGSSASAPWYEFYSLYDFKLVHWSVIAHQIPSMLALTFFGVLHVPINVPALAVSTEQDEVDVDRELIAHGISNIVSGCIGSIQNYLVYTNSLLFIRAGADSRVAGVMLAIATFGVMLVGPVVIGYIPVCVVGALIFLLGYELLKESCYDTIGRVSNAEYATIIVIVLTMGIFDFVAGIIVGIIIASFHFLWENAKIPIITNRYTGEVARSTVIRHPLQEQFLRKIGKQISVLKLQSFLFFGTIGKVEKEVKALFDSDQFDETPIRYLILDFKNVLNVDFSAAEGLNRIKKFVVEKDAYMIISIGDQNNILQSLRKVGIFQDEEKLQVFQDLNSSLEWCENKFLTEYKQFQRFKKDVKIPIQAAKLSKPILPINTPRNTNFLQEAQLTYKKEIESTKKQESKSSEPEPLSLLHFSLQGLSNKPSSFWKPLLPLFEQRELSPDMQLEFAHTESFFVLIESGVMSLAYHMNDGEQIYETLLPRTMCGRFSDSMHNGDGYLTTLRAKQQTKCWIINSEGLELLKKKNVDTYCGLMLIVSKLNEERFGNVTHYALIST